tara:strand:+ start:712 stop:858 length:147 start_codon:yes stop_codon:yes gene_type:complete
MADWTLEIAFHWPHDRFLAGWEFINADEEYDYNTFKLYLFIVTFTLDV